MVINYMDELTLGVDSNIELKAWKKEWAKKLFDLTDKNREFLLPWLEWVPKIKGIKDSEEFITTSIKEIKSNSNLELGIWFGDKLIGCMGLHDYSKKHKRADLGYWLDKDYWGRGIVTKSCKLLIDYGFSNMGLERIGLLASTSNPQSCMVAERLGFKKEGEIRQYEIINGKPLNYYLYSLLKSEWS